MSRCTCRLVHGVVHLCALCRIEHKTRPAEPWVPAEHCRTCLVERVERLEAELTLARRSLRYGRPAVDGVTGRPIPPLFLTPQGWQP
jgi:hypothetical protein